MNFPNWDKTGYFLSLSLNNSAVIFQPAPLTTSQHCHLKRASLHTKNQSNTQREIKRRGEWKKRNSRRFCTSPGSGHTVRSVDMSQEISLIKFVSVGFLPFSTESLLNTVTPLLWSHGPQTLFLLYDVCSHVRCSSP